MSTPLVDPFSDIGWRGQSAPRPRDDRSGHLEVVATRSQRRARPRTIYAVISIGLLLAIVVTQLLLSIATSQGAYQISSLQDKQTTLQRSYQAATEDLQRIQSPQNLAVNAHALGMVSSPSLAYLRLSDGAVLGAPEPAPSAGAATGNLIANQLLTGVTPVTGPGKTAGTPAKDAAGTPAKNAAGVPANSVSTSAPHVVKKDPAVPFSGALPSPTTH